MRFLRRKFLQIRRPHLAGRRWCLYGAWVLLVWFNALLPWWVILPVGAYLIAWHFSLQHEAIHSFRGVPAWLRFAVVYRAPGSVVPLPALQKKPHHPSPRRQSHHPGCRYRVLLRAAGGLGTHGRLRRRLLLVQSDHGRAIADRPAAAPVESRRQRGRARAPGRLQSCAALDRACAAVGILFWFISGVCGLSLVAVLPAGRLSRLEPGVAARLHRASRRRGLGQERTASVESNALFGMLYLYNNCMWPIT